MQIFTLLCVLFPIAAGIILYFARPENAKIRNTAVMVIVSVNSLLILGAVLGTLLLNAEETSVMIFDFGRGLTLAFRLDIPAIVFASILAVLWPLTAIYAFSYMKHEGGENRFFAFFIMTFGVVAGIACSGNFFTLYLFYELMTLVTLPLVMHAMDDRARSAGKKYLVYSMVGAAMVFMAFMFLYDYGTTLDFTWGGLLNLSEISGKEPVIQAAFVLGFFGFGVKAALFPFHGWLPAASVAPTPVTALLHAVAVVKSGAFSVMRLIYFGFGASVLYGTPAQYIAIAAAAVTIVYGSAMALRSPHLKRRLAYSTVANLSYILLAFATMTPEGLSGGLLHMIYHAAIKITLFFCAGAVLHYAHREYVDEMEGLSRRMPVTCFAFLAAALGLIGIPPLGGFISKLTIGCASASLENPAGIIGAFSLILSATLTMLYMMVTVVRFYFPLKNSRHTPGSDAREADACMTVPLLILTVLSILLALLSAPLLSVLGSIGNMI